MCRSRGGCLPSSENTSNAGVTVRGVPAQRGSNPLRETHLDSRGLPNTNTPGEPRPLRKMPCLLRQPLPLPLLVPSCEAWRMASPQRPSGFPVWDPPVCGEPAPPRRQTSPLNFRKHAFLPYRHLPSESRIYSLYSNLDRVTFVSKVSINWIISCISRGPRNWRVSSKKGGLRTHLSVRYTSLGV